MTPTSTRPYIVTLLVPTAVCAMANDETQPNMAADKMRIFFIRWLLLLHEMDGCPRDFEGFSGSESRWYVSSGKEWKALL